MQIFNFQIRGGEHLGFNDGDLFDFVICNWRFFAKNG